MLTCMEGTRLIHRGGYDAYMHVRAGYELCKGGVKGLHVHAMANDYAWTYYSSNGVHLFLLKRTDKVLAPRVNSKRGEAASIAVNTG